MGKTSTKLAVYALVQLLLFLLSGLVAAVDYHFYERIDDCVGDSLIFTNIPPYQCASVDRPMGSVEIRAMLDTVTGFYGGEECCNLRMTYRGRGCALGGGYTGVAWYPSLIPDEAQQGCFAQAKPTGIAYTDEATKGRWILTTDNATEMYTQMDTIPSAQTVDWLQAHGATFKSDL